MCGFAFVGSVGFSYSQRASPVQDARSSVRTRRPEPAANRVVVVVDVRLLREGLCGVLGHEPSVEVVGSASNWSEAASLLAATEADTVILDLDVGDPAATITGLRRAAPEIRVIGVGVADCGPDIVALAEAGLAGYVTRDQSLETLLEVIASVARGELVCSRLVAGALLRRVTEMASVVAADADAEPRLTGREREILSLIERGYTNKQISRELSIEVPTVKNHVHNLLEKLDVRRRGEAAALARRQVRPIT